MSQVKGLMRFNPKSPNTTNEQIMFVALNVIVNQRLLVLFLNTSRKAKIESKNETNTSVQNPVNEISVSKTVAK